MAKEVDHSWNNIDENHDVHDEIEQNGKIENDTKAGDDEREGHLFLIRLAEVRAGLDKRIGVFTNTASATVDQVDHR